MSAGPGLTSGFMNLETRLTSIMDVLVRAAVAEITQLVADSTSSLRLHLTQSVRENETLRMKMKVMRSELFTLRAQAGSNRLMSRPYPIRGPGHLKPRPAAQDARPPVSPQSPDRATDTLESDTRMSTDVPQEEGEPLDAPDVVLIKDEEEIRSCGSDEGEADFEGHNMQTDDSAPIEDVKPTASFCVTNDQDELKPTSLHDQEEHPLKEESEDLFSASELEALGLLSEPNVAQDELQNFTPGVDDSIQINVLPENQAELEGDGQLSVNAAVELADDQMGHPSHIIPFTQQQDVSPGSAIKALDCSFCGELFHTREEMIVHRVIHTGEPVPICTLCGKSFVNKTTLNIHMRIHTGEKPYVCTQCGKRFTQNGSLKIHMRTHSGEKPYVCNECPASFNNPSNLRRHMSTHCMAGL